jgi:vitamin B12 transporter
MSIRSTFLIWLSRCLPLPLIVAGGGVYAQTVPHIVISASQTPIEASKVGSAITVISGEEVRAKGFNSVSDALRTVPGVAVSQQGTRGSFTQVRIRGAEANHLLVVIDGVPLNAVGDGEFNFADMPVDDIERIEVLRGPQSGLYGANAHAGVITIETRSGRGLAKPQVEARAEGGTQRSGGIAASARGATGLVYGAVTATTARTDGFNIARDGSETDFSRRSAVTGKAGIDLTPYLNIEGFLRHSDRRADTDPQSFLTGLVFDRAGDSSTYEDLLGRGEAKLKLFDGRWLQSVKWATSSQDVGAFALGTESFASTGTTDTYSYKSTVFAESAVAGGEAHRFTVLTENRNEKFRYKDEFLFGSDIDFWREGRTRKTNGLAGEYVLDLAFGTTISTALRQDWNDPFADELTWRHTLSQRLGATGARLHASVGRGVTNPSFFEIYGFSPSNFIGNPDLVPESSVGWDVGIEQKLWDARVVLDATYFSSKLENEITTIFLPSFESTAVNLSGISHRQGVELTAKITPADWLTLSGSYTFTDSTEPTGQAEIRRPRHAAAGSAIVNFASGRGKASVDVVYNGEMPDTWFKFPSERVMLAAYTLIGGRVSYDLTPSMTAYVRAENLFDSHYEEVFSYRSPGFAAYAGVKMRLGD